MPISIIKVGARASPLSKAQAFEVLNDLKKHHPHAEFDLKFVWSHGDLDREKSLRTLEKTDFFTKELDQMVLKGQVQCAIHSAKDLPDPLPSGLEIVALTQGLDSSDSLVMNPGVRFDSLPSNAKIATSSIRREEIVKSLRDDLTFIDLRGTIEERIKKLETGEADGVVVAEAALIRLKLTHLNRIKLPGETTPFQGKLAIIAKSFDLDMKKLFCCLDTRL